MANYPTFISYQEALDILYALPIQTLNTQVIHFKNALNRICGQDICAPYDMPEYPTAAMDGYAICFDDMPTLLQEGLQILPSNKAGNPTRPTLQRGYGIKTFTGSLMPINSDTLIIVEHINIKNNRIFLNAPREKTCKSQWVRQIGENYKKGNKLLYKGDKIGAFEIGLLADMNQNFVQVYQKIKVGIISIGDEIIEVGEQKTHENLIRSINTHLLESLLLQMGQEPVIYPLLKDDKIVIRNTYECALKECDMVISSGGMSMGDYDYTQEVIQDIATIHFKGVRVKPGKPVLCASRHNKLILGLPGYPNSCAVSFLLFAPILIAKLQNRTYTPNIFQATLLEGLTRKDSRMEFRACEVYNNNGVLQVSFKNKKSLQSSMINNLTHNSALAILEENGGDLAKGDSIKVMFLNHF